MLAIYNYAAGATQANIMADVVAIITGTTDVANLSAACMKGSTYIFTGYEPSNWEMHDNAAGTNAVVLRSLNSDGVTYKYLGLDFNTANKISIGSCESWNPTTHTGTNFCVGSTVFTGFSIATGFSPSSSSGYLHIHATPGHALLGARNGAGATSMGGVVEISRDGLTMDVSYGYPCHALMQNDAWVGFRPRAKHPTGVGSTTSDSYRCVALSRCSSGSLGSGFIGMWNPFRDINEVVKYPTFRFDEIPVMQTGNYPSGIYEPLGYLKLDAVFSSQGNVYDEFIINGKTYIRLDTSDPYWIRTNSSNTASGTFYLKG